MYYGVSCGLVGTSSLHVMCTDKTRLIYTLCKAFPIAQLVTFKDPHLSSPARTAIYLPVTSRKYTTQIE